MKNSTPDPADIFFPKIDKNVRINNSVKRTPTELHSDQRPWVELAEYDLDHIRPPLYMQKICDCYDCYEIVGEDLRRDYEIV